MVLARWIPENVAISITKYSVLTMAYKFFVVLFIFLLLFINHSKGRCKWANFNILQLGQYPRRHLVLLKSLYWLLVIFSTFTFFISLLLKFRSQNILTVLTTIFFFVHHSSPIYLFLYIERFLFRAADESIFLYTAFPVDFAYWCFLDKLSELSAI